LAAYIAVVNITIFGASRGVGRAAVQVAVARGHTVTAVARSGGFLAGTAASEIAGDVFDADLVARALIGAEAILVALGTSPAARDGAQQAQVCSRGTRVILEAMRSGGPQRIVVVSSYGVGPTRERRPFPFNVVAATLLKDVMADKEAQEREVRESETQWTIVQPLGLTDGPATGTPFVSTDGSRQVTQVARADVATVCIEALESGSYLRETIAISGRK
jgi:putative NADH-flavin reductase